MMYRMSLILALVVTLFVGCASAPATEKDMTRRTYDHDYDKLFDTTKKTLLDLDCEIVNADKQGFSITAKIFKKVRRERLKEPAYVAAMGVKPMYIETDIYTHYQFAFLSSGGKTTIQASIFTSQEGGTIIIITGPDSLEKTPAPKSAYQIYWRKFQKNLKQ